MLSSDKKIKKSLVATFTFCGILLAGQVQAQDIFAPQFLHHKNLMSLLQMPTAANAVEQVPLLNKNTVATKKFADLYPFLPNHYFTTSLDHRASTIKANRSAKPNAARTAGTGFGSDVFGSIAIGFGGLPAAKKLSAIANGENYQIPDCKIANCSASQTKFSTSLRRLETAPLDKMLHGVNALVNEQITYRPDVDAYGKTDYWASPAETIASRSGDCEDYAVLKMAALENLGVDKARMSIVVLRDDRRKLFHAVLTVRTDKGNYVLDNVHSDIKIDNELSHYTPLYSVSAGKGYIHGRKAGDNRTAMNSIRFDRIAPGEGA